jgi:hypothetical protein
MKHSLSFRKIFQVLQKYLIIYLNYAKYPTPEYLSIKMQKMPEKKFMSIKKSLHKQKTSKNPNLINT